MKPAATAPAVPMAGLLRRRAREGGIEAIQGLIRQLADPPQQMTGRDPSSIDT